MDVLAMKFRPKFVSTAAVALPLGAHPVSGVDFVAVDVSDESVNVTTSFPAVMTRPKIESKASHTDADKL